MTSEFFSCVRDALIQAFLSYFISYFNDTIDRLAFIQQQVLLPTDNKEISVASLLIDVYLPCSYTKRFSEQKSCKPSRIVSFYSPEFQALC